MHRFLIPDLNLNTDQLTITHPDEIHHLKNVLRLKKGNKIQIFNGQGQEVRGEILEVNAKEVSVHVVEHLASKSETENYIVLACAIPKKAKFETIIEKTTELGVDEIVPLLTHRTDVKMKGSRLTAKLERYHRVAISASKQCRRATVPTIQPIEEFKTFLQSRDSSSASYIACTDKQGKTITQQFRNTPTQKKVVLIVGPEGGFTPNEVKVAIAHDCKPVSLGETILKVDTAAIALLAFIKFSLLPT